MSMHTCYVCGADASANATNTHDAPAHAMDLVGTLCKGCFTTCRCGAPGKHAATDQPVACDACALATLREDLEKWRSGLLAIMKAVGGDELPPYTVDRVGEILAARIEALKARKPTLEEAQAVIVAEIDRLHAEHLCEQVPLFNIDRPDPVRLKGASVVEPTQDLVQAWGATCVGESGPGIAAKHKDVTLPERQRNEAFVCVDDDQWDE